MLWVLWLDDEHRAANLHLEFDIIKGIPVRAEVTDANANEKTISENPSVAVSSMY